MPWHGNYKSVAHTRTNDGTSSDLSQNLAQHPGWLMGAQAFSLSSAVTAHLYVYDTAGAVTTASVPIWQGVIPFAVFIEGTTRAAVGAGVVMDLAGGITLNNGLAYAVTNNADPKALSTYAANLTKVSLQYMTSSCL